MENQRSGTPPQAARTCGNGELFIHLRLETSRAAPLLAQEDVAQAAQTALTARAKMHRCRVLAVGFHHDHMHALLCFPASLPISDLVRLARDASAQAIADALWVLGETDVAPERVWSPRYGLKTLSAPDLVGLAGYVRQHPLPHVRDQAQPEWESAEALMGSGQRPAARGR